MQHEGARMGARKDNSGRPARYGYRLCFVGPVALLLSSCSPSGVCSRRSTTRSLDRESKAKPPLSTNHVFRVVCKASRVEGGRCWLLLHFYSDGGVSAVEQVPDRFMAAAFRLGRGIENFLSLCILLPLFTAGSRPRRECWMVSYRQPKLTDGDKKWWDENAST
jgi:hypothetical protein